MSARIDWGRTLRAIAVATLLLIALIGAVLASIGSKPPTWLWAGEAAAEAGTVAGTSGTAYPGTAYPSVARHPAPT